AAFDITRCRRWPFSKARIRRRWASSRHSLAVRRQGRRKHQRPGWEWLARVVDPQHWEPQERPERAAVRWAPVAAAQPQTEQAALQERRRPIRRIQGVEPL